MALAAGSGMEAVAADGCFPHDEMVGRTFSKASSRLLAWEILALWDATFADVLGCAALEYVSLLSAAAAAAPSRRNNTVRTVEPAVLLGLVISGGSRGASSIIRGMMARFTV